MDSTAPEILCRFAAYRLLSIVCLLGEIHLALGQSEDARKHFLTFAGQVSQVDPMPLIQAARGLIRLGEFNEALKIAERLQEQYPTRPDHHFVRGLVKLELSDRTALDDIDKAILASPRNNEFSGVKILALFSENDHIGVLKILNRILAINANNSQLLLLRGIVYLEEDDLRGALRDFEAARELTEKSPFPHFGLAIVFSRMEQESEADEALRRGLSLDRSSSLAHYAKGMVDFYLGRRDNGIASLESAVQIDPTYGEAWFSLGRAYQRVGRYSEALSSLSNAGQRGEWKAYAVIQQIHAATDDWKVGHVGPPIVWGASIKEAAAEIKAAYDADLKQPPRLRRFAKPKNAIDRFYKSHSFPNERKLTKMSFYNRIWKVINPKTASGKKLK